MNIEIKSLNAQNVNDFLKLFDITLHKYDKHCACYCTCWNMTNNEMVNEIEAPVKNGLKGLREATRDVAKKLIITGKLHGYMAYINDEPVGWCNANDSLSYCNIESQGNYLLGQSKSIMCFRIAEDYRRLGIATLLLKRVCEDAKRDGYQYVEVYPIRYLLLTRIFSSRIRHTNSYLIYAPPTY